MSRRPNTPTQAIMSELALEAADIGLWSLDLQRRVISYDPICQAVFGLGAEMTYEDAFNKIYPEDIPTVQAKLAASFDPNGDGAFAEEFRLLMPEGPRWTLAKGVTIFSEGETREPLVFTGMMLDITERKTAELELATMKQTLEARVEARTREVQNLAAQLTSAEQKERQALAKVLHDSVQQELYGLRFTLSNLVKQTSIDSVNAKELDDLILETITTTRHVTKDLNLDMLDDPDLARALRGLADSVKERYDLRVRVDGAERCEIDNLTLRTLVFNLVRELLFNVVKHSGVKEAGLHVDLDADGLTLSVKDLGRGFVLSTYKAAGGTGLGLSGAHKRLALYGGTLTVDSGPAEGTHITIQIPRRSFTLGEMTGRT